MDMRNELRLDWLPPPPLERKRKVKPEPVVYVFGEPSEQEAGVATSEPSARSWRRGVAIYEL